jgi:hypothetical protein
MERSKCHQRGSVSSARGETEFGCPPRFLASTQSTPTGAPLRQYPEGHWPLARSHPSWIAPCGGDARRARPVVNRLEARTCGDQVAWLSTAGTCRMDPDSSRRDTPRKSRLLEAHTVARRPPALLERRPQGTLYSFECSRTAPCGSPIRNHRAPT